MVYLDCLKSLITSLSSKEVWTLFPTLPWLLVHWLMVWTFVESLRDPNLEPLYPHGFDAGTWIRELFETLVDLVWIHNQLTAKLLYNGIYSSFPH